MRSFEHGYLLETPISHTLLMSVRALGEFAGRQVLYRHQSPEALETLRRVAMVQSTESSNRIEGIEVTPARVAPLVERKAKPQNRPEQEVAGYRDVLATIHAKHDTLALSTDLVLGWHKTLYRYTSERGGAWKAKNNVIWEIRPDGRRVVRFTPVSALATPDFMERLVRLFREGMDDGRTDPLLLIASFILDLECIHPFADGNGRIGRLLTLFLLYQSSYEVGRYISLERIVEESKETYYEALLKSSQGWHAAQHDLRPWWNYFLGMLTAACKEFEGRVGTIASAKGAKREVVRRAIEFLPSPFSLQQLLVACPGISRPTVKRALAELSREGSLQCLARGPAALWERV